MLPVLLALLAGCSADFAVKDGAATLAVTPVLTDAGTVAVGDVADLAVTLAAAGGDVQIRSIALENVEGDAFTLTGDAPDTVSPDAPVDVSLAYAPTEEGRSWATITVTTDEATHEVTVRGEAAVARARIVPSILDFGPVQPGTSATRGLTVVNDGRVAFTVDALDIDDAGFALDDTVPVEITVGARTELSVTFTAPDASEHTGEATLVFDGPVTADPVTVRANACPTASVDSDGDGFTACAGDCDDWDPAIVPSAAEICDGVDQDCDGTPDDGTTCADDDGDGASEDDGDCNDADPAVSPNATEIPQNGVDDDCDGVTDAGGVDGDGDGYAAWAGDCDDTDPAVFPGAPETADGTDEDCDGVTDEGTSATDDDGDGYREDTGDCDDADAGVHPYATELADGIDDDCDGTVDEGTDAHDDDGDGFTEDGGDCDDTNANVNPGALEVAGNRLDEDCDGVAS